MNVRGCLRTAVLALAILASFQIVGCGSDEGTQRLAPEELDLPPCAGKCDSAGPLSVSSTWVPRGGYVRATVDGDFGVTVRPVEGTSVRDAGSHFLVQFEREGFYTVSAVEGSSLVSSLAVRVSDQAPALELSSPTPGSFVQAPVGSEYEIRGNVVDPLGKPLKAKLRGKLVTVGPEGDFVGAATTDFGLNFVAVEVTDVAHNKFSYVRSFLAAPRLERTRSDCAVSLKQDSLDLLLSHVSKGLPQLIQIPTISEPVASKLGNEVYIDSVVLPGQGGNSGTMDLELLVEGSKLASVLQSSGNLIVKGRVDWVGPGTSDFTATMSNPRVAVKLLLGEKITAEDGEVSDSGLAIEIDWFPDWLAETLSSTIRERLADSVEDLLPTKLSEALEAVEGEWATTIPSLNGGTIPVTFDYDLTSVKTMDENLVVSLSSGVEGPNASPEQGAPVRDLPLADSDPTAGVSVQIPYDLLNRFSYELWNAGGFETTVSEADLQAVLDKLPAVRQYDPIVDVLAEFRLPPVISRDGGGVQLSFGQLEVELFVGSSLFQLVVEANLAGRVTLAVEVESGVLKFVPALTEVHVDIGQKAFSGLNVESVEALLREMAPALLSSVARKLEAFHLPSFDMTNVGLPGTVLELDNARLVADESTMTLAGDLVGKP